MRILLNNIINSFDGDSISAFNSSLLVQHSIEALMNDYPSAEWISYPPKNSDVTEVTDSNGLATGEKEIISNKISFSSSGLYNGIYLGGISSDSVEIEVKSKAQGSSLYTPYLSIIKDLNIDLDQTNSSLLDNKRHDDYFWNFPTDLPILTNDSKTDILLKSKKNLLSTSSNISFIANSVIKTNIVDNTISGDTIKFWKIRGNFQVNSNTVPIDHHSFLEKVHVGMCFLFRIDGDNYGDSFNPQPVYRVAQVFSIQGTGENDKSVTLLMRNRDESTKGIDLDSSWSSLSFEDKVISGINEKEASISGGQKFLIGYAFRAMKIGILRIGEVETFPNPQTGFSRNYKDHSIKRDLNNGSYQYLNKKISKQFSASLVLDKETSFRFFNFAEKQRARPFPIELITDMDEEHNSVVFAYFTDMPSESMSQRLGTTRDVSFSVKQIV